MSVIRRDPTKIPSTLKEAIADSLCNLTFGNVSGSGAFGEYVFGAPPSKIFVSGFLLPHRGTDDGDEVTSPIWISSHGMDLQLSSSGSGIVRITPKVSVYVRVLPATKDLLRPDCKPKLSLKDEKRNELKQKLTDALNVRWEKIKDKYDARWKCPEWKSIQDDERINLFKQEGLPSNLDLFSFGSGEVTKYAEEDTTNDNDDATLINLDSDIIPKLQDDHFDLIPIPPKWKRFEFILPPLELDLTESPTNRANVLASHEAVMESTIAARLKAWADDVDPVTGGKLWVFRQHEAIPPSLWTKWNLYLEAARLRDNPPVLPEIKLGWDIEFIPDFNDSTRVNFHVAIENRSELLKRDADIKEHAVFQVGLDVVVPQNNHCPLRLDRVEPSYRFNRYLQYAAIGFNGGVEETPAETGKIQLSTTWHPRYVQPRLRPIEYPNVISNIRQLAEANDFQGLRPIVKHFRAWIESTKKTVDPSLGADSQDAAGRETEKFMKDLKLWEAEADGIEAGINILEESKAAWSGSGPQTNPVGIPFEAWRSMNEAMANLMKRRLQDDSGEWRLFQLAFILASLPSLVTRLPEFQHHYNAERDDSVTLLYFSTGGGKSEAFFGLLAFNLFLDRLRNKIFGVTALVRYPLRLLTVNQAQRMAKMMAEAEQVRQAKKYGGAPFSIGFWVGSGGSPNRHNSKGVSDVPLVNNVSISEEKLFESDLHYAAARKAWRKLPSCPFCGAETGIRRLPTNLGGTIAHVCQNESCYSRPSGEEKPLPFYICDDDIYDLAPSVILGTVDKLALIGHSGPTIRRILGMFGAAPWYNQNLGRIFIPTDKDLNDLPERKNCISVFPAYASGLKLFHDPVPTLIVQDEAHLLDESLGTFAGLFESTLDALFERIAKAQRKIVATDSVGNRRRAKVIAASATVSEPQRQLEHLYQRHIPATQFPSPGPDIYNSFYAGPETADELERRELSDEFIEFRAKTGRIYVGIMTNGRPHTATAVAILSAFHVNITQLTHQILSGDKSQQDLAVATLVSHIRPSPISDLMKKAILAADFEEIATLIDLHRVALTYVTNKKGGDQIQSAEGEETRKRHASLDIPFDGLPTRLITGSVDQGEIEKTVELTRARPNPGEKFEDLSTAIRSIIATSSISHGVDIEELNSMFFAGMPSDIAEYIQASSRVGRTHVGFVLLVPTPQRRRDRYIIEVFDIFHRFLERMVQPAAIDRWAEKAVSRSIPSIFQAAICGAISVGNFLRLDDDKKGNWVSLDYCSRVLAMHKADKKGFEDTITAFIELAIGLTDGFAPDGKEHYQRMVREEVRSLLDEMAQGFNKDTSLKEFFGQQNTLRKPMTSLRDVDQAGLIRKGSRDPHGGGRLDRNDVLAIMETIRYGQAEIGDSEETK